jgi:hypothetical protein
MKKFLLKPLQSQLDSPHWDGSTHKNPVPIMAPDAKTARDLCHAKFRVAVDYTGDCVHPLPVWQLPEFVECTEVNE